MSLAVEAAEVAVKGFGSTALSFLGGAQYWLIAIAVASAVAFGGGYWTATSQAENKLIAATAEAYSKGTAAQQKYDAAALKAAKADFNKRAAANKKRDDFFNTVLPTLPTLVPEVKECTYSADAMKKLNEVTQ